MTHLHEFRLDEAHAEWAECVAIYADLDIESAMAQFTFGAVKAFLGEYAQAQPLIDRALQIAQKSGHHHQLGPIFYLLGFAQLAQTDYRAAQPLLQKSVTICRSAGIQHEVALALCYLSFAERGLGNLNEAQNRLAEAIRIGIAIHSWPPLGLGVASWSLLLAERGELARAAEFYALHMHFMQGRTVPLYEDMIGCHFRAMTANLPAETIAAATARGQARNLWSTAHEILVEIDGIT